LVLSGHIVKVKYWKFHRKNIVSKKFASFTNSVLKDKKILIIECDDELKGLSKSGQAKSA
jgi:hypothetical protein